MSLLSPSLQSLVGGRRVAAPPDPSQLHAKKILLASEGRRIPPDAVDFAARLAEASGASVHVLSIARIHGTSFGLQVRGLLPNKRELGEQRESVTTAVRALKKRGLKARGQVLATRGAGKHIVRTARRLGCDAIVMAADPPRHWFVADFMWSQEPYRVRRRARLPVYLVVPEGGEVNNEEKQARGA